MFTLIHLFYHKSLRESGLFFTITFRAFFLFPILSSLSIFCQSCHGHFPSLLDNFSLLHTAVTLSNKSSVLFLVIDVHVHGHSYSQPSRSLHSFLLNIELFLHQTLIFLETLALLILCPLQNCDSLHFTFFHLPTPCLPAHSIL